MRGALRRERVSLFRGVPPGQGYFFHALAAPAGEVGQVDVGQDALDVQLGLVDNEPSARAADVLASAESAANVDAHHGARARLPPRGPWTQDERATDNLGDQVRWRHEQVGVGGGGLGDDCNHGGSLAQPPRAPKP